MGGMMFEINIFGKDNCARCSATKKKINHFLNRWGIIESAKVNFIDMESVDGLAEGTFNNVAAIPTTILTTEGRTLGRWDQKIPRSDELRALMFVNPPRQ